MAYTKNTTWVGGGAPGISHTALNNLETQYDEASTELGSSGGAIAVHGDNLSTGTVPSVAFEVPLDSLSFKACYFTTDLSTEEGGVRYDKDDDALYLTAGGSSEALASQAFTLLMAIIL